MEELTRLFTNVFARYDVLKNQLKRVGVPQEVFGITNQFEAHLAELKTFAEGLATQVEGAVKEEAPVVEAAVNEAAQAVEEHTETTSEPSTNGQETETQNS